MNKIIFESKFNTYFNGFTDKIKKYNGNNETKKDWLNFRAELTKKYCIPSLVNQTNQNFIAYFYCRAETIDYIKKLFGNLPQNIKLITPGGLLEQLGNIEEDYLYSVRVDSDDMWKNDIVEKLHNYKHKPETEILINQWCYNYEVHNKRLARFFYPSPQSYVLVYNSKEYLKGKRHRLERGHMGAIKLNHEILEGANYMDTIHGTNICSRFDSNTWQQFKEFSNIEEKREILEKFGVKI
jgi:hypothetical protein